MEQILLCPYGGDETNDCEDCAYSIDYHFKDGECVERTVDDTAQQNELMLTKAQE